MKVRNDGSYEIEIKVGIVAEGRILVELSDTAQYGDMDGHAELTPDEARRFAKMLTDAAARV